MQVTWRAKVRWKKLSSARSSLVTYSVYFHAGRSINAARFMWRVRPCNLRETGLHLASVWARAVNQWSANNLMVPPAAQPPFSLLSVKRVKKTGRLHFDRSGVASVHVDKSDGRFGRGDNPHYLAKIEAEYFRRLVYALTYSVRLNRCTTDKSLMCSTIPPLR